jgi:hypothetical protein
MTIDISANLPRISYTVAAGVTQTSFTVPFEFFDDSDLNVYIDQVLQTITTNYTVTGGSGSTGTVTMTVTGAKTVIITRDTTIERTTDFTAGVDINRAALNTQLDTLTAIAADNKDFIERSIRIKDFDPSTASLELPDATTRANKLLSFDTEGGISVQAASDLLTGSVLGANYIKASHTGDGTIVAFSTTEAAGSKNNIQVYIDGVYQNKDTFSISGSTLTFTEAPPLNSAIEFIVGNAVTSLTTDPDVVTYNQGGTGAQDRTLTSKLQDTVSVKDFGAVGDGVTDDTAAIQAAIAASAGKVLNFVRGETYLVTSELNFHTGSNGPKVEGNMATIKAGAAMQSIMYIGNTTSIKTQINNIELDGNSNATYCLYAILVTENSSIFSNVIVKNATSHGMYLDGCQVMRLENIVSQTNGGDGILFESCNGASISSIRCVSNTGNGITVQRGTRNYTSGVNIEYADCELNSGHGISVVDTKSPVTILGGWLESNVQDGLNIGSLAVGVSANGIGIIGNEGTSNYRAVRLQDGAAGCSITNAKFQITSGSQDYANVKDENTSLATSNLLTPNFIRSTGTLVLPQTVEDYKSGFITQQQTTTNTRGAGGYLSGFALADTVAGSSGTKTFTWTPSGSFNIPGADNRGAYMIELDIIGYFTGIDQSVFLRFHLFGATLASTIYDASSNAIYSYGDTRKSDLTLATPTAAGSSGISAVLTNANASTFNGTFTWRTMMTTTGQLSLAVS